MLLHKRACFYCLCRIIGFSLHLVVSMPIKSQSNTHDLFSVQLSTRRKCTSAYGKFIKKKRLTDRQIVPFCRKMISLGLERAYDGQNILKDDNKRLAPLCEIEGWHYNFKEALSSKGVLLFPLKLMNTMPSKGGLIMCQVEGIEELQRLIANTSKEHMRC